MVPKKRYGELQMSGDSWAIKDKKSEAELNKRIAPYSHYKLIDAGYEVICDDESHEDVHIISDYTVPVRR
jgi:hypothetical protein